MKYKKLLVSAGLLLVCSIIIISWYRVRGGAIVIDPNKLYAVAYVVDGDTFKANIDGKIITVRMLGINTPETVDPRKLVGCFGPEASERTKGLLTGQKVRLSSNPGREEKDKYGRYLLFVHLASGLFVNEELIKDGYAREYTVGRPYQYQKEFRFDQKEAQVSRKGLWAVCVVGK